MVLRLLTGMSALFMVFALLVGGAQPGAVGLFTPPLDKLAHMAYFLVFTLLLLQILPRHRWLCLVIAMLIGGAEELHQWWLPGREANLFDWLADATGASVGLFLQTRFFPGGSLPHQE